MGEVEKKVKLHATWYSPYSNRVEMVLKLKGVEYERLEEDLCNKSPELVRHNPVHKKIPVLLHGSNAISESQLILEYIDETWDSATPILPRDPYERALARFWARFIDDKLFLPLYRGIICGEEQKVKEALENMKFLDKELEGKRFFGGEQINFVDIVGNIVGYWVAIFEEAADTVILSAEAFPSVCRWRHEYLNCEFVQETLPAPKAKLVAYYRDRFNTYKVLGSEFSETLVPFLSFPSFDDDKYFAINIFICIVEQGTKTREKKNIDQEVKFGNWHGNSGATKPR